MIRPNIRRELTVWYGAVLAATLGVFGLAAYSAMWHSLHARTDAGLFLESEEVAEEVGRAEDRSRLVAALERRFGHDPAYGIQVATTAGELLFRSVLIRGERLPAPTSPIDVDQARYEDLRGDGEGRSRLLCRSIRGPGGPLLLEVAVGGGNMDRELGNLLRALLTAGPLAIVLALAGGYMLARRALAPVDRMAAETEQITSRRLDRRLDGADRGDELGRLATTLNGMMARLESSFDEIRRFTADAAHELRTPPGRDAQCRRGRNPLPARAGALSPGPRGPIGRGRAPDAAVRSTPLPLPRGRRPRVVRSKSTPPR